MGRASLLAQRRSLAPDRIELVDALRGFALLGICLVNAPVIAGVQGAGSSLDNVVAWLVTALCATKFYLLFSFLFGYSFTLRMRAAGHGFTRQHLRRLVGLFAIGLVHAVLLYAGDILITYSVLGLLLLAVRHWAPRTAFRAAVVIVVALTAVFLMAAVIALTQPLSPDDPASFMRMVTAYRGSFEDIVAANVQRFGQAFGGAILYSGHLFAAFLVGIAAGKLRLLADPLRHMARLKQVLFIGILIGLPGNIFMAMCQDGPLDGRLYLLGSAVGILTAPFLTAAYACGFMLLLGTRTGQRVGKLLAAAGRMSLTNYLMQSLVLAFVFTGYGLALYGGVGQAVVTLGCFLLYGTQILLSHCLMNRTRYGPAELILRRITRA